MKKLFILFSLFLFACALPLLAEENEFDVGTVKVDAIPIYARWDPKGEPPWKSNRTGATPESIFSIQIDDLEPIKISYKHDGEFTNLQTDKKHLVKISLEGKMLESFWFDFKRYKCNELRLWYKPMYGTWSLWPDRKKCPRK